MLPGRPGKRDVNLTAPSYSGLVLRPLTAATPVQIRLGSPLGKKPGFFGSQAFLFISVSVGRPFRFYGAAVSLSRRRSLRRGTPGHDGFPRALGIMPRHFLRRGIRTHNEIPRALGIMRPHHRTHPVGVTLGKSLDSSESRLFCLYLPFSRKTKSEKPHVFRKATIMVVSRNTCGFSAV